MEQPAPLTEFGSSAMILSRRNLLRHDINNFWCPQERARALLAASSEVYREWIEASAPQEPEAEAWNQAIYQSHNQAAVIDDTDSVAPSSSAYLCLTPAKKAALCGFESSNTAITRLVGFVPLSAASPEAPSSWRKRLREVEQDLTALRSRVDAVEERTGAVIGEGSRDCHAFRLRRLEAACGLTP